MKKQFLNKFKSGNTFKFENYLYDIIEVIDDCAYYDFDLKKQIDKYLHIILHKKNDSQFFSENSFFIFYEENKVVLHRVLKKEVNSNFLNSLRNLKKDKSIQFENKQFKIKQTVKSIKKFEKKTYDTYNYVLVSDLNDKEKVSMNIIDYEGNEKYDVYYLETRQISEESIQFK